MLKEIENNKINNLNHKENIENQIINSNNKILSEFKKVLEDDSQTRINEIKLGENKKFNQKIDLIQKQKDKNIEKQISQCKIDYKEIEKYYYYGIF